MPGKKTQNGCFLILASHGVITVFLLSNCNAGVNWNTKGRAPGGVRIMLVLSQLAIYSAAMIMQSVGRTLYINVTSRKKQRKGRGLGGSLSKKPG